MIDESGEHKRKQPPIPFRTGTREVHNKLEKDRRAHLKECFDVLKKQLPRTPDERKASNLSILHAAINYIRSLKKLEQEYEHEMERLARIKIQHQQNYTQLKKEIGDIDVSTQIPELHNALHNVEVKVEPSEIVPPPDKIPLPRVSSCQPHVNGIKEVSAIYIYVSCKIHRFCIHTVMYTFVELVRGNRKSSKLLNFVFGRLISGNRSKV